MKKTMVLSPKIQLVINLQTQAAKVFDSYAVYADTESTLCYDQEERQALSDQKELELKNIEGAVRRNAHGDIYLMTTKHIYIGKKILRAWRRKKAAESESNLDRQDPTPPPSPSPGPARAHAPAPAPSSSPYPSSRTNDTKTNPTVPVPEVDIRP